MRPEYQQVLENVKKLTQGGAQPTDIVNYLRIEGLTIDDLETFIEGPSVLGQTKEAFKGLIPGAVGLVETAGVGAASLLPESMEESVRSTIQETAAKAREPFKAAPGYEETIPRKLSEAVGSTIPFLAAGPFGLAGRAAAVGLGTAAGAGEARLRAEEEGATEEQRASATGFGVIPGAFEAFAPLRILGRLGNDVVESGVDYVKRALIAGGEEAAQEAASGFAQNLIAQGIYKPEQELIEGLGEQAAYGGATGAIIQGLLDLAIGRRAPDAAPVTAPLVAPVGVPATAEQLSLFTPEEAPLAVTQPPEEGTPIQDITAAQAESMRLDERTEEGLQAEARVRADELRDQFDRVEREVERLNAAYPTATPEEQAVITQQANQLIPVREAIKTELQKIERRLVPEERGRVAAPPEQMGLFDEAAPVAPPPTPEPPAAVEERPEFALEPSPVETPVPEEAAPEVETRPVVEDDFKTMGIGITNKKLREKILGKDIADPEQRAEVREALEDYANAPNRSEKLRNNVEQFLTQPMFMQQMELGLETRREPDGTEPSGVDGGRGEPSVPPSGTRRTAPAGTGAPDGEGVVQLGGVSGVSDEGTGVQQRPMRPAFVQAARRTYNKLKDEGAPSWRELGFDRQMEFMDAFEQTKGIPRYRLATEGTQGMSVDKVQKLVDRLTSKWKNAPDIFVVQSTADLADYGLTDIDPSAKGVFYGGDQSVFLIADNITDYTDAVITVAHESIGHFGLQSVLGDKYNSTMDRLYETNPEVRKLADEKIAQEGLDKRVAVEEVLAEAVEKKIAPQSALGRALATLRNVIRNFLNLVGAKASNSEIDSLINQAANYVIAGTVQVDKKVTNTDAFKDWFGDSVIRNPDGSPKIMYHGTAADITEFKPKQANAIFVTDDPQFAEEFTGRAQEFLSEQMFNEILTPEQRLKMINEAADKLVASKMMSEEQFIKRRVLFKDNKDIKLESLGIMLETEIRKKLVDMLPAGPNVMPLYVRAEKPFDYDNRSHISEVLQRVKQNNPDYYTDFDLTLMGATIGNGSWKAIEASDIRRAIDELGFDSFYVEENGRKNLGVFDPNQVKSATGNAGTFRRDSKDIRLSKKASEPKPLSTDTKEFKRWFGESKVVDKNGDPLVVYHGTAYDFSEFAKDKLGSNTGAPSARVGFFFTARPKTADYYARGDFGSLKAAAKATHRFESVYDTPTGEYAENAKLVDIKRVTEGTTPNVMPVYLSLQNPLVYDFKNKVYRDAKYRELIDQAIKEGRDGVILRNTYDSGEYSRFDAIMEGRFKGEDIYVVFEPTQIKSAIGNIGTFDPKNPDIRYRKKKPVLTPAGERAQALNERMKGISNPKDAPADETLLKRLTGNFIFKSLIPSRRVLVDKEAPVIEQVQTKFNNAVKDALDGTVRPDLLLAQKQDISNFGDKVVEVGGIEIDKNGFVQLFERTDSQGRPVNMDEVLRIITVDLGNKLGSAEQALQLSHNALIGFRASELQKVNAKFEKDAQAAEAKGNKRAAQRLRDQKVNIKVSQEEINTALETMQEFPEIRRAYDVFTEFKNGLVDFLEKAGRINPETAKNWKENVGYVPWTRVEEEVNTFDAQLRPRQDAYINLSKVAHLDKEGSNKQINNIFDNMVGTAFLLTKMGVENHANLSTLKVLPDVKALDTPEKIAEAQKKYPDRVMFAFDKGERTGYLLSDPFELQAFMTLAPIKNGTVASIFAGTASFVRSAITHLPAFAISQLIQDGTYRAMLLSGVQNPWSLPPKVFGNFFKLVFQGSSAGADELARLGITGIYDGMPDTAVRKAKERMGLEHRNAFKKAWDGLEKFSLNADLAVRAAIYEQTMRETGGDRALAYYRAKEYINFKRQGTSPLINTLRQSIPFMNAYMQGMDVLYRTMIGKGVSTAERKAALKLFYMTGAKLAALNILYTMLVTGDDEYEGLDEFVRNRNYIIPGTGIKIPVAPEVGLFFKVLPEQLYRAVFTEGTQTPQDAEAVMTRIKDASIAALGGVGVMPAAIMPFLEVFTNYSFFFERPIVGAGMRNLDTDLQFTESTSELAKLLGSIGNMSPMKVDYLIRAYTGMAGAIVLDTTDALANPDRLSKPIYRIPQISTFMYDPTGRGLKSNFYDFREDIAEVRDTINMLSREGRFEELEKYVTPERLEKYAFKGIVGKIEKQISELRKYRKIISSDTQMSPEERRRLVDEIAEFERQILRAYDIPNLRKMAGY
jgi:hypothetical protein